MQHLANKISIIKCFQFANQFNALKDVKTFTRLSLVCSKNTEFMLE